MKTKVKAKESVNAATKGLEGFLEYPIYKVVSVFENPDDVDAAVADLSSNGFSIDDIETFCGLEGSSERDFKGTQLGIWASFIHAFQRVGPERTYLERYEKALNEGHCLLMVQVQKEDRKQKAAEILHSHTGERVTYFGLTMADEIKEHSSDEIAVKAKYR